VLITGNEKPTFIINIAACFKLKSMKKIASLIILFFLLFPASEGLAQGFRLGLTGSPSVAWFKSETETYDSKGVRFGVSYGLISEFVMAPQYSFATGINVIYFGGKLNFPIASEITETTPYTFQERIYRLQNVEVPFTLKMKTREIGHNVYFAKFGFGASVNLNARANDRFHNKGSAATLTLTDVDIKSQTPLFRASMILGLGFEHSLGGSTALLGGITFNNGFTNMLKGRDFENIRKQQARANYLELTLGLLF
jgi:hypothetical protein